MMTTAEIHEKHQELVRIEPRLRVRDAADRLGVPEAQLVAAMPGAIRLRPDFAGILRVLPGLGEVMALTRNGSAVHEKRGSYPEPSIDGGVALIHSRDIDLRIFLRGWGWGFAVRDEAQGKARRSLQFFDPHGDAVHKIWLEDGSDVRAFDSLVADFAATADEPAPEAKPDPVDRPDADIDLEGLRAAWRALQDTHEFFGMLRRFEVGRLQAFRLAGDDLARPVPVKIVPELLELSKGGRVPIMVFVGNRGMVQIHSGPIENVAPKGDWLNVLDRTFNLHLRMDRVDRAFIVRKPTVDGDVTSLELFDREGHEIALFFGERKPGIPEAASWREALRRAEELAHG